MVARGRAGGPPTRGASANRAGRGGAAGGRGAARQPVRGGARAKGSLPGKSRLLTYRLLETLPTNQNPRSYSLTVLLATA